mmetsp:Transcript_3585/g.5746  ORF Transcript_3585/g.5746 Transcript_3585/m.5746 type:complete len:242 (+) Transcript_3585:64-789(+)
MRRHIRYRVLEYTRLSDTLHTPVIADFFTDKYAAGRKRTNFVSFVAAGLKTRVLDRMSHKVDTLSGRNVGVLDDVAMFVGEVIICPRKEDINSLPRAERPQQWVFASGEIAPQKILEGVVLDSAQPINIVELLEDAQHPTRPPRFPGYKHKLCKNYSAAGYLLPRARCQFGEKCMFAHGNHEIRCRDWALYQMCRDKCAYLHETANPAAAVAATETANRVDKRPLSDPHVEGDNKRHRGQQ